MAGAGWLTLGFLACDVFNNASNLWVPIRGILCDGSSFQFFEYRSDTSTWSSVAMTCDWLATLDFVH
jgi:hypothetical protein